MRGREGRCWGKEVRGMGVLVEKGKAFYWSLGVELYL